MCFERIAVPFDSPSGAQAQREEQRDISHQVCAQVLAVGLSFISPHCLRVHGSPRPTPDLENAPTSQAASRYPRFRRPAYRPPTCAAEHLRRAPCPGRALGRSGPSPALKTLSSPYLSAVPHCRPRRRPSRLALSHRSPWKPRNPSPSPGPCGGLNPAARLPASVVAGRSNPVDDHALAAGQLVGADVAALAHWARHAAECRRVVAARPLGPGVHRRALRLEAVRQDVVRSAVVGLGRQAAG